MIIETRYADMACCDWVVLLIRDGAAGDGAWMKGCGGMGVMVGKE